MRGCLFLQRHSVCGVPLLAERSNSVSTINSSESRRPSDSARVPDTLEETDSATHDEQWTPASRPPWEYHQTRQQWHRDRWLFNEHINKQSSDVKFPDADSGTDLNHVSESSVFEESKLSNLHNTESEYCRYNNTRNRSKSAIEPRHDNIPLEDDSQYKQKDSCLELDIVYDENCLMMRDSVPFHERRKRSLTFQQVLSEEPDYTQYIRRHSRSFHDYNDNNNSLMHTNRDSDDLYDLEERSLTKRLLDDS